MLARTSSISASPSGLVIEVKVSLIDHSNYNYPWDYIFVSDVHSNFGHVTHRSKGEMGDRTGLCGAGLMELEARHNSILTCPIKSREG